MATKRLIQSFFVDTVLILCIVGALACALLLSLSPPSPEVLSASTDGTGQLESDLQQVTLVPIVSTISYTPTEQAVILPDDAYSASTTAVAVTPNGTQQKSSPFVSVALLATACFVVLQALNDLFDRIYRVGITPRYYKR